MMALSQARREYQKEAEQVMNQLLEVLSQEQGEKLKRIVAAGPPGRSVGPITATVRGRNIGSSGFAR